VSVADGGGKQRRDAAPACADACCTGSDRPWAIRALSYGFGTLPRDIGKALLGGLVVAAVISALNLHEYIAPYLGGGVGAILIMMLLGVPVYVCATASVPVAAALVVNGGVSPGAALAFLMTGPATNAATLATVWRVLGRRTALIYLATVAGSAFLSGLTMDALFEAHNIKVAPGMGVMLPGYVRSASAVALLGILGWSLLRPLIRRSRPAPISPGLEALRLSISGMTCSHCAAGVRRALLECPGVTGAEVDLETASAAVTGEALDGDALCQAVADAGYAARLADASSGH